MKKSQVIRQQIRTIFIIYVFLVLCFCALKGYARQNYIKRIISLGPAITEQLYLLGAENNLVANTVYCTRPTEAQNKEKIGTVIEVNLEKIVSLKPDLVIATSLSNPKQIQKLENLGIRVLKLPLAENFQQICKQFLELGKVVKKEKEAQEIIKKSKKEVDDIYKTIKNLPKPKVIVQVGTNPLWVATQNSFVNDFIKFAGGINIGPYNNGLYSREKIIKDNPDIIIIITMGIAGKQEKEIWQKYKTINAVKNNKIYIMDSYKLCSPTPVSFVEMLKEIVEILHPKQ